MNAERKTTNWIVALLSAVGLTSFCLVANRAHGQVPQYTVTNLGALGGTSSVAYGINNRGQVVGTAAKPDGSFNAVFYSGTGSNNIDLGKLGGPHALGTNGIAFGINDSGQIVGSSTAPSGFTRPTLFSGTGSDNLDLGSLNGPGGGAAYSINNVGQIVGSAANAGGSSRATLFSGTGSGNIRLGADLPFNYSLRALSISDAGHIVGEIRHEGVDPSAGKISIAGQTYLGTLGGISSQANGVNDLGQIVGWSLPTSGTMRATLFSDSGPIDLGALNDTRSSASSINNAGQIVGNTGTDVLRGFVYTDGTMYELNNLVLSNSGVTGIHLQENYGNHINEWGQIAAQGYFTAQGLRALRLDPVEPLTTVGTGGISRNTKFLGDMDYGLFSAAKNPGGLGTTADLLSGTAGSAGLGAFGFNRDVDVSFSAGAPSLASDMVNLTGTEGDQFVLQLTYDVALAESLFGGKQNARLGWFNGEQWVLAVDGNSTGTPTFVEGAWNDNYSLGFHGVDTDANTVWAVLDHNSVFAVVNVTVPEPGTAFLCLVAGALFQGTTLSRVNFANANRPSPCGALLVGFGMFPFTTPRRPATRRK